MNIGSIGGASATTALAPIDMSMTARASSVPPAPGASATISKPGEMLSKLKELQEKDPAKFKEVVTKIASDLKAAAGKATGDDATRLGKLADAFSQVASSGDLSALQPPQQSRSGGAPGGQHHGGHHHHHGGSGVQSALSSALDAVNQALTGDTSQATSAT